MRIDDPGLVELLEDAWSPPDGFLFQLREGTFNPNACDGFLQLLRSIHDQEFDSLPARVVSLLWYVPSFFSWQRERVVEAGGDISAFNRAEAAISSEIERVLGVP